jgi:hypothetical protein
MFDDIDQRIEESTVGEPVYVRAKMYDFDSAVYASREIKGVLESVEPNMITVAIEANPGVLAILRKNILAFKGTTIATDNMEIYIELHSGERFSLFVEFSDTIENLKVKIQDRKGFTPDRERLIYEKKQLEDGRTLSDYQIGRHSVVHMELMEV